MERVVVNLGDRARLHCEVARTAQQQSRGLQGHPGLALGEGMIFPFAPARATQFHMGSVHFPIDLVFADASHRIARIVHGAQPGSADRWGVPICAAVIETPAGVCRQAHLQIGDRIAVGKTYNLLRTITEADAPPLTDGYYSKEPDTRFPGSVDEIEPDERFRHEMLPTDSNPDAHDNPIPGWGQTHGYDPTRSDYAQGEGESLRMSAYISSPVNLAAGIAEAFARTEQELGETPLHWQPDMLNAGRTESAVVRMADIEGWLETLDLAGPAREAVMADAQTENGLFYIGTAFVEAEVADGTSVAPGPALVLWRGVKE